MKGAVADEQIAREMVTPMVRPKLGENENNKEGNVAQGWPGSSVVWKQVCGAQAQQRGPCSPVPCTEVQH